MSTYLQPIVVNEKTNTAKKLISQLDSVPTSRLWQASFKAVIRLQLFFTGRTHELFGEFSDKAQAIIVKKAGSDQILDGTSGYQVESELTKLWGDTFKIWSDELQAVRTEAASIPFGVLAVTHERLILPEIERQTEEVLRGQWTVLSERAEDGVFAPQLRKLLNAAENYLYGDTLNLSQRIWRIDRDARDGINMVLLQGISSGDSAWNIAQNLEQFVGASQDCPRWTSTRLYGLTKSQIAQGDTRGLVSTPCDGRGVSYNALRLARTEIQKAHALATDKVLMAQPWVQQEQIHLSAAHPEQDICDETVQGGENGQGIYSVGEIELPLHPNCLCYKTAVLMDHNEFTSKLRGWVNGTEDWSGMDEYADLVGDVRKSILPDAINLAVWMFGENLENWIS